MDKLNVYGVIKAGQAIEQAIKDIDGNDLDAKRSIKAQAPEFVKNRFLYSSNREDISDMLGVGYEVEYNNLGKAGTLSSGQLESKRFDLLDRSKLGNYARVFLEPTFSELSSTGSSKSHYSLEFLARDAIRAGCDFVVGVEVTPISRANDDVLIMAKGTGLKYIG